MLTFPELQEYVDATMAAVKRANAEWLATKRARAGGYVEGGYYNSGRGSCGVTYYVGIDPALPGGDDTMSMKWTSDVEDSVTGKAPTTLAGQIAVMAAYERGEKILMRDKSDGLDGWSNADNPAWGWDYYDYCIAPEPEPKPKPAKYRPYTHDELMGLLGTRVKAKVEDNAFIITAVMGDHSLIGRCYICSENLLKDFTWMNGTPLGMLVE